MRLGVFGGTFDPPHLGHLILAGEARDQLHLDEILWVLTPDPPHKQGNHISPISDRLALLEAAIRDEPHYIISDVELRRPGPHYALDTVRILKADFPHDEIIYLIGGDSLRDMPTWHKPQELVQAVDGFGVMRRPHARFNLAKLEEILPGVTQKTVFVESLLIEISASDIRRRVREGRAYRHLVPAPVFDLIESLGLYR